MAKEVFPQEVKNALIKDRWKIAHDLLTIRINDAKSSQARIATLKTALSHHVNLIYNYSSGLHVRGQDCNEFLVKNHQDRKNKFLFP